ncbi:MAG: hypothetical protein AAB462_01170 [Patescibacteria group bacterium]|mgnify:CR=1 FL=1
MIDEKFVLLAALLNIIGSTGYAIDTIKGKNRPNRVTWLLWAIAPLIAFSAEIGEGVGWQSLMTFMVGFGPLMIFIASFVNKKAHWKISKLDIVCGGLSVAALVLWLVTGTGIIAIIFCIIADLLAAIPTVIKSFNSPQTESYGVFRNGALSAAITLLTIDDWTFAHYGFPLYILLICALLYGLIRFKIGARIKTFSM